MDNKKSLNIDGEIYYVQLRAENAMCLDFRDFLRVQEVLASFSGKAAEHLPYRLVGYCLLPDSWHLLVIWDDECEQDLGQIGPEYNQLARHQIATLQWTPPVLVENGNPLAQVIKAIHTLPVHQGLVASPNIYPWSSHSHFAGDDLRPWVNQEPGLNAIANHRAKQRQRYLNFMQGEGRLLSESQLPQGNHPEYLAFASQAYIQHLVDGIFQPNSSLATELQPIINFICSQFHCNEADIAGVGRHRFSCDLQGALGHLALELKAASFTNIAIYLGQDEAVLRANIDSFKRRHPQTLADFKTNYCRAWAAKLQQTRQQTVSEAVSELPKENQADSMAELIPKIGQTGV